MIAFISQIHYSLIKTIAMKNKFLNISIGVTMMLLGAGFFVRSITSAHAAPTPQEFVEQSTNKIGKFMFQVYMDGDHRYALVWDTETGKSKSYHDIGGEWNPEEAFPDNPLGE
jgi:hypothetical protein